MSSSAEPPFVTGLVLAAGGSRRLGQPKQLLRYGRGSLLEHVLDTARDCALTSGCACWAVPVPAYARA